MADTTVIQSFLAELGFKVERTGLDAFTKALKGGATQAVAFGDLWAKSGEQVVKGIAQAAEAVVKGVLQMTEQLNTLYFASRRIGDSVENIQAFGYAMSQLGEDSKTAQASLEHFAEWGRKFGTAGLGFLQSFGVQVTDPLTHRTLPTTQIYNNLLDRIYHLEQNIRTQPQAEQLRAMYGIPLEEALTSPEDRRAQQEKYHRFAREFGVDSQDAAKQANAFQTTLKDIQTEFGLLVESLEIKLLPYFQAFANWLEKLPALIERFKNSQFGRELLSIVGAVAGLVAAIIRFVAVIVGIFAPTIKAIAKPLVDGLRDAINFLKDTLNFFSDLLTGNWSAAWKHYERAAMDALRFIAHGIEAAIILQQRLAGNLVGAQATKDWADKFIDQMLPEPGPDTGLPGGVDTAPTGPTAPSEAPTAGPWASGDGGGGPAAPVSGNRQKIAAYIQAWMVSHGISPDTAWGIAAGVIAESGGNPRAFNRGGGGMGAYGIGQWRGSRLQQLMQMFGQSPSLDQQLMFMLMELRGQVPNEARIDIRGGAAVLGSTSAGSALYNMVFANERPGYGGGMSDMRTGRGVLASAGAINQTLNQTTTIHVASSDAHGTATLVAQAQHRVNANAMRALKKHAA